MIAVLRENCRLRDKAAVVARIEASGCGLVVHERDGRGRIGVVGNATDELAAALEALPGVDRIERRASPCPLASREYRDGDADTIVRVGEVAAPIGRDAPFAILGGPCAVESREQLLAAADYVAAAGAQALRGGAFKPRTSPYSFQGLGVDGLRLLAEARAASGLPVVTEVVAVDDVEVVAEWADMLQIGARNMQNFRLLTAVGRQDKPVLLKRGMMATVDEFLLAAEYVLAAGNPHVVLCERGIRTFERASRATLDLAAVPWLRARTHLPILIDPSHAAGRRELVESLALAGVAAGADGLIVETHPRPDEALSDRDQALDPTAFRQLVERARRVAAAVRRPDAAVVSAVRDVQAV